MSPRTAARTDGNQKEVVAELRKRGCVVAHTHMVGKGFPDIVVGYNGRNYLFEIKDPAKPPSKRRLTKDEEEWFAIWLQEGQVAVIETADQAMEIMRLG